MKSSFHNSNLTPYLHEIDGVPLLSPSQERALSARIAQGDAGARETLVLANLRLVVAIAREYRGKGLDLEDLIEEGNLGLMRAAEGYDGGLGVRFSTYAAYWIKQSIRTALTRQGRTIRLPYYMMSTIQKWRRKAAALTEATGKPPTPDEIGAALGLSAKKTAMVVKALQVYFAAHGEQEAEGDTRWLDSLTDDRDRLPERLLQETESRQQLECHLSRLRPREAAILRLRFGLGSESPMTLREIGKRLALTRERVRQIERDALQDLAQACDTGN